MKPILRRNTNTITIANFWENYLLSKYNFDPPYQRRSVWSEEKQSFFIDSVLRNFPVPPIFLRQRIDNETGTTTYEVIDGKQRLMSLARFIGNEIPCSSELTEEGAEAEEIAGKFFKDLDAPELLEYKHHFWRYALPVEYVDTATPTVIDQIFDRLNRNGEPLVGQELRNAKYYDSPLLILVKQMAAESFWAERLKNVDQARMEHYEFVSEAIFVILEKGPQHANQAVIDEMYKKYTDKGFNLEQTKQKFDRTTNYLKGLNIEYDRFKLRGVSHLYGLWCFAFHCCAINHPIEALPAKLNSFFTILRDTTQVYVGGAVASYSASMSARTKDQGQRMKRVNALCAYCNVPPVRM